MSHARAITKKVMRERIERHHAVLTAHKLKGPAFEAAVNAFVARWGAFDEVSVRPQAQEPDVPV